MISVTEKSRRRISVFLQLAVLSIFAIVHYSGLFSIKIANANPIPAISLIITVTFFSGMWRGVTLAFIYGMFMDTVVSGTVCFNTLALTFSVLVCGVLITYFFNRNISAIIVLGFIGSTSYFILKWFFLYLLRGVAGQEYYLFSFAIPSAIYTAVFIVPFYYIGKYLEKHFYLK